MKKFVITGIQMRNKGSQAMFLSLYYTLRSLYPDCEVVGFANKYDHPEQYTFDMLPYDDYTRRVFKYHLNKILPLESLLTYSVSLWKKSDKWNGKVPAMEKALREADAIFDASGYTLGSGWSKEAGELLLQTIRIARSYNKKIILMPQSFGPFNWADEDNSEFLARIKDELEYCLKIYAREKEGYDCLTSLGLKNVALSQDMVIREKIFPTAQDIHTSLAAKPFDLPPEDSVGFIINQNVFRIGDPNAVLDLYAKILDRLIDNGENVYIINTSTADTDLVNGVLGKVRKPERIQIISGEHSSPTLIEIISRFKYVVASRYHSVVFAYRSGVPAVILGWASKYTDLAEHFQQQDYVVDIRDPDTSRIFQQIDRMSAEHANESQRIKGALENIQTTSVVREAVSILA